MQMNKNDQTPNKNDVYPELSLNVITRQEHNISRKQISDNALKVLYRLHGAGFEACLVGGGVRDLLWIKSKDFDVHQCNAGRNTPAIQKLPPDRSPLCWHILCLAEHHY